MYLSWRGNKHTVEVDLFGDSITNRLMFITGTDQLGVVDKVTYCFSSASY